MVDNRYNTVLDKRTALKRVKGLGASGGGTEHFWLHRLTAIANIPLVISFVWIISRLFGRSHEDAVTFVSQPFVAILLILLIVSVTIHMRLGLQTFIEDYVHSKGAKLASLVANNFFAIAVAISCLFAVIKISLASVI